LIRRVRNVKGLIVAENRLAEMGCVNKVWDGNEFAHGVHVMVCHAYHNGVDAFLTEDVGVSTTPRCFHGWFKTKYT